MERSWINTTEYPFKSNFMQLATGQMHYVDEGSGEPIVMLHGNPAWSFLYRKMIKKLRSDFRCIAPDHIGFGLSEKPFSWSYLPKDHAKNFEQLMDKLAVKDITLVINDWGGPIGLSYAINHPENVKRLIICNTWCWSVKGDPHFESFGKFMGSVLGSFLIKYFNFFAKVVVKSAFGDKKKLDKETHRHYYRHLKKPKDRKGSWVFPREIIGSSDWLNDIWNQREKIKHIPTLIAWGSKDIAFREKERDRFLAEFENSQLIKYEDCGHYVAEEKGEELAKAVREFVKS